MSKCGECLFSATKVVELVDDVCPECGADYTKPATEDEIAKQAAATKPIVHTAGVPAPKPKVALVSVAAKQATKQPDKAQDTADVMTAGDVIAWLRSNGHTSQDKGLGAIAASKALGQGVCSGLAKSGLISTAGIKRGAVYWVSAL